MVRSCTHAPHITTTTPGQSTKPCILKRIREQSAMLMSAHLWQRHEEGLHVCAQVACSRQVPVHLPALCKFLEAVVKLAGHHDLATSKHQASAVISHCHGQNVMFHVVREQKSLHLAESDGCVYVQVGMSSGMPHSQFSGSADQALGQHASRGSCTTRRCSAGGRGSTCTQKRCFTLPILHGIWDWQNVHGQARACWEEQLEP